MAATIRKIGARYHFPMDVYHPTGSTGETIREEREEFDDLDEALREAERRSGIPLHEFRA